MADLDSIPTARTPEQPEPGAPPTSDPRDRAAGVDPAAPAAVLDVARGHETTPAGERSAVGFLLGQQKAPRYKIRVDFATDDGDVKLWFFVHSLDSKLLTRLERNGTDETKVTATGMPEVDNEAISAAVVAEATISISDGEPGTSGYDVGAKVKPTDAAFMAGNVSAALALQQRFHWQEGLLSGIASQVRRISGWAPDRVGQAERVLVDTAGGS